MHKLLTVYNNSWQIKYAGSFYAEPRAPFQRHPLFAVYFETLASRRTDRCQIANVARPLARSVIVCNILPVSFLVQPAIHVLEKMRTKIKSAIQHHLGFGLFILLPLFRKMEFGRNIELSA